MESSRKRLIWGFKVGTLKYLATESTSGDESLRAGSFLLPVCGQIASASGVALTNATGCALTQAHPPAIPEQVWSLGGLRSRRLKLPLPASSCSWGPQASPGSWRCHRVSASVSTWPPPVRVCVSYPPLLPSTPVTGFRAILTILTISRASAGIVATKTRFPHKVTMTGPGLGCGHTFLGPPSTPADAMASWGRAGQAVSCGQLGVAGDRTRLSEDGLVAQLVLCPGAMNLSLRRLCVRCLLFRAVSPPLLLLPSRLQPCSART